MKKLINLNTLILCASSGLMTQLALSPGGIFPLAFVALIPFFFALHKEERMASSILIGFLVGFFSNLFGFYWMVLVFQKYFLYSEIESIGLFVAFSTVGHLQFLLFSIVFNLFLKGKQISHTRATVFALLYTVIDFVTPKLFGDTLGYAFENEPSIRQFAHYGGVHLLTLIATVINLWIFADLLNLKDGKIKTFGIKASILSLIMIVFSGSFIRESILNEEKSFYSIKIAMIQPNTSPESKHKFTSKFEEVQLDEFRKLIRMSKTAVEKEPDLDLIVWPETSYPGRFQDPEIAVDLTMEKEIKEFLATARVPILFGGYNYENGKKYNSAFLIQFEENSIVMSVYNKTILAFMGEYNPISKTKTLDSGTGPKLLKLKTKEGKIINIAPLVCYESVSSLYSFQAKKMGADLFVHIANESWFGYYGIPHSYFGITAFRAIENRIPLLKVSNSGFSALISSTGEPIKKGSLNKEEIIIVSTPVSIQP